MKGRGQDLVRILTGSRRGGSRSSPDPEDTERAESVKIQPGSGRERGEGQDLESYTHARVLNLCQKTRSADIPA